MQRARSKLGVKTDRAGFGGGCFWVLPVRTSHTSQVSNVRNNEKYEGNGKYGDQLEAVFRIAIEAECRDVDEVLPKLMSYIADWSDDDLQELINRPDLAATVFTANFPAA